MSCYLGVADPDRLETQWGSGFRLSMCLMAAMLLGSTLLYSAAARVALRQPDYRTERDSQPRAVAAEDNEDDGLDS